MEQEVQEAQEDVRSTIDYGEEPAEETAEESTETTEPEAEGESAEETPAETKARIEFTEEQQKYINEHIIARQVAKRKEAERELEEYRQRLQQSQPEQPSGRPEIPEPPNIWDDDYEAKIKARDEAIRAAVEWEAQEQYRQQYEQQQKWEQQQKEQEQLLSKVTTYTERAKEYGIDESDLQVAGNAVAQFGIPEPLIQYILEDDAGPAITMHLSRNLQELDTLNRMDPIKAAVHIATTLKPKATRNAQRRSKPPEPTDSPRGSGVPEKERGPKGAVYE
jgi:hypothetical protein